MHLDDIALEEKIKKQHNLPFAEPISPGYESAMSIVNHVSPDATNVPSPCIVESIAAGAPNLSSWTIVQSVVINPADASTPAIINPVILNPAN